MVSRYRSLLALNGVRRLLVSSVFARLPLGICALAILLFLRGQSGSFLIAGLAVGAFTLLSAAVAPLQGVLIDRVGQLRVLVPCAVGQSALLVLLVLLSGAVPVGMIVALAGLAGALTPPVSACVRVLWPRVAAEPSMCEAAYALDAITQEIIWVFGPLLVALIIETASAAAAVLAGAAITFLGTGLFASSPLARDWKSEYREPHHHSGALSSRGLRALLGSVVLMGTMIGALEVGLPALATRIGSHSYAGVLLALLSLGSMTGGLLYGTRTWPSTIGTRYVTLLAVMALCTVPLVVVHTLVGGMLLSVIAGLAIAPIFSCQYTLVGKLAPQGAIAEAFTWQTAALVFGIAIGSALGGTLVDLGGERLPFALASTGALVACLLALLERRCIEPLTAITI